MRLQTLSMLTGLLAACIVLGAQSTVHAPKAPQVTDSTDVEFWPFPEDWEDMPACETEDQEAPDCKWIAEAHSNGSGTSFYVKDGSVFYVRTS